MNSHNEDNNENVQEEEDEEYGLDASFMFDNSAKKLVRNFEFGNIKVQLFSIDDEPGACQSGHYIWPAAPAMSKYLLENLDTIPHGTVLELGSGVGLVGLVMAQVPSCGSVMFTDHDPGVLETLNRNISELDQPVFRDKCRSMSLEWGVKCTETSCELKAVDLVVGSDVIYCKEVVEPLLTTAASCISQCPNGVSRGSLFLMCSSFKYDVETEQEIDRVCSELGLDRKIVSCHLDEGGVRLQHFVPVAGRIAPNQ